MTAPSSFGSGLGATSRAVSNSRGLLASAGGAVVKSVPLLTVGMPHLIAWARQVSPIVVGQAVTVALEVSVRPLNVGPDDDIGDEWLRVAVAVLDPAGTPTLINVFFPVAKIRLRVVDAPAGAYSLDYVLACSA